MSNNFDEVLVLEESFYGDGYKQGFADGVSAGQVEGRTFGLEKGFEKYVESSRLHGKSLVWANRLSSLQAAGRVSSENTGTSPDQVTPVAPPAQKTSVMPSLTDNARLAKHVKVLYALAESESLSTENTEDAVSDFDDRLRRAQAKAKIIERMVGEQKGTGDDAEKNSNSKNGSIEDINVPSARH